MDIFYMCVCVYIYIYIYVYIDFIDFILSNKAKIKVISKIRKELVYPFLIIVGWLINWF